MVKGLPLLPAEWWPRSPAEVIAEQSGKCRLLRVPASAGFLQATVPVAARRRGPLPLEPGVRVASVTTDFSPGTVMTTGNLLDVALEAQVSFRSYPRRSPLYTRWWIPDRP